MQSKFQVVMVEWVDASGFEAWQTFKTLNRCNKPMKCYTIGFVIAESKDAITLAGSISENGKGTGDMTIPKRAIVHKKQLGRRGVTVRLH